MTTYNNKNRNFIQEYTPRSYTLRLLSTKSNTAFFIFQLMKDKMNKQNLIMITPTQLSKISKKSRATVYRALKLLTENNYIREYRMDTTPIYAINSAIYWKSKASYKENFEVFYDLAIGVEIEKEQKPKDKENWDNIHLAKLPMLSNFKNILKDVPK